MTETLIVARGQDGAYDTIGAALTAAPSGAVVSVAPGTYYEALFVTDRHIVLVAEQGPGTVVVDVSSSAYPVLTTTRSQVDVCDLTIKAGEGPVVQAGDHSRVTVSGCTVAGPNGISVSEGSGFIARRVRFLGMHGPVVVYDAGCQVVVEECTAENGDPVVAERPAPAPAPPEMPAPQHVASPAPPAPQEAAAPAPQGASSPGPRPPRPAAVAAAVFLMLPAAVLWFVAGIAWMVVTSRMEGDAMFLFWILAVAILGLCLLVSLLATAAMVMAWFGAGNLLNAPGGVTLGLFAIVIVNLVIQRKIEFNDTQILPIVVGILAGISMALANSKPAVQWFQACEALNPPRTSVRRGRPPAR